MDGSRVRPIRHIRPIFSGLGRGLDLLLPSFLLSREEKKEPAGLRLFPKGNKYRRWDSIIRSSRIVCGAYAIRPYVGGCAPRPHPPRLSPVGAIWGAYAIRPYKRGFAPTPLAGAAYVLRPLTVLCDPLYKCAGRLWVLVGWGRGVMGCVWGLNDLHAIY